MVDVVREDPRARYAAWVAPLCWFAVLLDGYDLVVLGTVLPSLLELRDWGLDAGAASLIATVGLLGVMVGALVIGPLSDVLGRRRTMLITVSWFSSMTLACAFAPGPVSFAVLRFLGGLGLGGVLPIALALINEYAPSGRGGAATTRLMTGYHVGAVTSALLGIVVIERFGWEWMFVLGALPALVLVPLMLARLPESGAYLASRSRREAVVAGSRRGPRTNPFAMLFGNGLTRSTIALWVTSFMGLLLVYGLNTWLPQIMRAAGYELGAALTLLLVLNIGAVLGLLVAGQVADRIGQRTASIAWFATAAVFLALLSVKLPGIGVYVSVLLAGVFVFSSQVLVYAYVSHIYPTEARATALGAASGVGRAGAITGPLVGGALLDAGIAYPWGFYVFAVVAALGAISIAMVRRDLGATEPYLAEGGRQKILR